MEVPNIVCKWCEESFIATTPWQKFCKPEHRNMYWGMVRKAVGNTMQGMTNEQIEKLGHPPVEDPKSNTVIHTLTLEELKEKESKMDKSDPNYTNILLMRIAKEEGMSVLYIEDVP